MEGGYGRFDLVLEAPGDAYVIVESKLDAPLTDHQLARYLDFPSARAEPLRALVSLTAQPQMNRRAISQKAVEAGVLFAP